MDKEIKDIKIKFSAFVPMSYAAQRQAEDRTKRTATPPKITYLPVKESK